MSSRRSRDKGARTERAIVRLLQGEGLAATKVSGMYKPGADISMPLLGSDRARIYINGREIRRSLQTSDPKVAAQRRKSAQERVIADKFGDATRGFVEVVEAWSQWIGRQVGPSTCRRYACSLDQLQPYLDGKTLSAVDGRLVSEIAQARASAGVSNATIKRDLVALSSVMNFAIDQGWRDDNPVLPRLRRIKERRDPIVPPLRAHIDLVIARCPGMVADVVKVAMATGVRTSY